MGFTRAVKIRTLLPFLITIAFSFVQPAEAGWWFCRFVTKYFSHTAPKQNPVQELEARLSTLTVRSERISFSKNLNHDDLATLRWGSFGGYREHLKELKEKISNADLSKIDTVLYPMAGHDSQYPFTLIPNSKITIALDDNDFVSAEIRVLKPIVPHEQREWLTVGSHTRIGEKILSNILISYPGSKIKEVRKLTSVDGRISGYIHFRDAEGTDRVYLHISTKLEDGYGLDRYWWKTLIPTNRFALMMKASMGFWRKPVVNDISVLLKNSEVAAILAPTAELERITTPESFKWIKLEKSTAIDYGSLDNFSVGYKK